MSLFSLKKIAQYAGSRQIYLRGVSCYGAGCVTQVTCSVQPPFSALWKAAVFSDDRIHTLQVQAGFDTNGDLIHSSCTCTSACAGQTVCRHVVALLVHKYYTDMLGKKAVCTPVLPAQTDHRAAALLQAYRSYDVAAPTLSATALLQFSPSPLLQLSVTTADRRSVTVHDWMEFCARLEQEQTAAYGKSKPFLHRIQDFRATDQPLLHGLIALSNQRRREQLSANHPLSDLEWELLLPWLSSNGFLLRSGVKRIPCRVCTEDPILSFSVQQTEGGLFLSCDPFRLLPSLCGMTLLYQDTLYRCSLPYAEQIRPLLLAMEQNGLRQFWSEEDLPAFCDTVWSGVSSWISLQGDTAALLQHLPPAVSAEIYLDNPSAHRITARVAVRYGEQCIDLLDPRQPFRRNLQQEQRLFAEMSALFPLREQDLFAVEGDQAVLDAFLEKALPTLQQLGSIFVAEDQKTPLFRPQPAMQVGLSVSGGLLEISVQADGWDTDELLQLWNSYRRKRTFHRLKNGQWIDLRDGQLVRTLSALQQSGVDERHIGNSKARLPSCRALLLQDRLQASGSGWSADRAVTQLLQTVRQAAQQPVDIPPSLQPLLRHYQKQGVSFLQTLTRCGFGGILADDMGLGKTVQVLTLLQAQKGPASGGTALVVCPSSLILNWEHEAHKFTPSLRVRAVYGPISTRRALLESEQPVDLLITSYDLLKRDLDWYRARPLTAVILDEAQYIKNHATQNARAVKALQAPCRLALTGTPIENRLSELWSIFDFLMPGFLFSYPQFREQYERPILQGADAQAVERLHRHIAPFVLRRTKEQVLQELPPKVQTVRYAVASDTQQKLYRAQLLAARGKLQDGAGKIEILAALTRLRQLCCDPTLCFSDYSGGSAKLDSCMELVEEAIGGGHKILLFSQFTSMLQRIAERLRRAGHRYYLLQGSTSKQNRSRMVDAFNSDDTPVMLVSLKAGGTGLNLTGADVVIHYDPWWNAAATDQATDRAHRIGQTRPVQVYTLLLKDTIEEKILLLQQTKRRLANGVIPVGGGVLESISREQLLALLQD